MFTVPSKLKITSYVLIAVGLLSFIYGFFTTPDRAWSSLLANNFFFLAVALGASFFLAIQYVAQVGWSVVILRPLQAMGKHLPVAGAIMVIIIIFGGMHKNHLYHWMDTFITTEEVTVAELRDYETNMHHAGGHDEHADEAHEEEAHEGDDHATEAHAGDEHHDAHAEGGHAMYADHYADMDGEEVIENPHYDSIIAGKTPYLNFPFFLIRALVYLLGWIFATRLLRKYSLKEDQDGGLSYYKKSVTLSAVFLVFFAVTSSMSAWDWIMSIDTHWFSTLFGWYVFAGMFVSALTTLTLIIVYLKSKGYMEQVNENHLHDLGKFMFAFSIFWTYLWFSQYMLIWYSNIPEEVTYYMARFDYYKLPFLIMLVLNFVFPILVMISRDAKRHTAGLIAGGIFIIIGHWLDVMIMIYPGTIGKDWAFGLVEIGGFFGFLGIFLIIVFTALSKAALIPKNHPMLKESEVHHI